MHYFKVFHNHTAYTHENRLGEQNIDPWLFQKPIINIILLLAGVTDLNLFSSIVTYPQLNLLKQELTRIGSHTFNFIRFSVFSLDTLTVTSGLTRGFKCALIGTILMLFVCRPQVFKLCQDN